MTTTVNDIKILDMVNKNKLESNQINNNNNPIIINNNEILLPSITPCNNNEKDKTFKINKSIVDESIEQIFKKDFLGKNKNSKSSFFLDYNNNYNNYNISNSRSHSHSDKKCVQKSKKKLTNIPSISKKTGFLFNKNLSRNSENNSIISNINLNSLENVSLSNADFKKTIKKIKDNHNKSMIKIEDDLNKRIYV